jgi:hypothetical protein
MIYASFRGITSILQTYLNILYLYFKENSSLNRKVKLNFYYKIFWLTLTLRFVILITNQIIISNHNSVFVTRYRF